MPVSRKKEPKETVTYPASKRKAPPFKPQRPSKVVRVSSGETESSTALGRSTVPVASEITRTAVASTFKNNKPFTAPRPAAGRVGGKSVVDEDEDDEDDEVEDVEDARNTRVRGTLGQEIVDDLGVSSDDDLEDNPLAAKPRIPPAAPARKSKPAAVRRSPSPISSTHDASLPSLSQEDLPTVPPDSATIPSIPQALLMRLLHTHFHDKTTKIDKHALVVLQKYFEVFVREAIARAGLEKRQKIEEGGVASQSDVCWLEKEDLEAVVGGLVLDF